MKRWDILKALLLVSLFAWSACGESGDGAGGEHTGTLRVIPDGSEVRRFYFDKEEGSCEVRQNEPACDGGTSLVLYATGGEEGSDKEIGVDLDYCGPSGDIPATGYLQVDVGIVDPEESFFVFVEDSKDLRQGGNQIHFSAPYYGSDSEVEGTLHFEADCDRGGLSLPF